jgi:hypothetical protein
VRVFGEERKCGKYRCTELSAACREECVILARKSAIVYFANNYAEYIYFAFLILITCTFTFENSHGTMKVSLET